MRTTILATTFNGTKITPTIEWFVEKGSNAVLDEDIYKELKAKVGKDFKFISKDLEELQNDSIKIDKNDFISKFAKEIKDKLNKDIQPNKHLQRVKSLYEIEPTKAEEIFQTIDSSSLNEVDKAEYLVLKFKMFNKNDAVFNEYLSQIKDHPQQVIELYFDYIKHLEDKRDERRPLELIEKLFKTYPLTQFSEEELATYNYLKGRNFYLRGEFLLALRHLSKALTLTKDKKREADIYNTTANCFTDNLFFDEAMQLAKRAMKIRKKLHLNEDRLNSISLIGGIYLKQNNPDEAFKQFKKVLKKREDSRIYNYLAKTSILQKRFKKASKYISLSKQTADEKGFLTLIELLYHFEKGEFKKVRKLFDTQIEYPKHGFNFDKFVLGWSNYIVAKSYKKESKMKKYIERAVNNFLDDNYILEAYFVSKLLDSNVEIEVKVDKYIKKHSNIVKEYKDIFSLKEGNNNLLEFKEKYQEFNLL